MLQNNRTINQQVPSSTLNREHTDSDFPRVSIRTSNRQVTCSIPGSPDRRVLHEMTPWKSKCRSFFFAGDVKRQLDVKVFRHTCLDTSS